MIITTSAITLDMKEKIQNICYEYQRFSSAYTFTSLFIWQKDMKLSILLEDDFFAIKIASYGDNAWFFPCGNKDKIKTFIKKVKQKGKCKFLYADEEDLIYLQDFEVELSSEDSEYIYSRIEQAELKGKKFSKLRNHVNRVKKDHKLEVKVIFEDDVEILKNINKRWSRHTNETSWLEDVYATKLLLANWQYLDVYGILVYVDDLPYAFVLGYPINDHIFDISIAQQIEVLSGLSVYAKQEFIKSLPSRYKWVNAEEDLGLEGLRMMKEQMKPIFKLKMYKASYNG